MKTFLHWQIGFCRKRHNEKKRKIGCANEGMMEVMSRHIPVLCDETVEALCPEGDKQGGEQGGIYVDATYGGGGHTRALRSVLNEKDVVYAFDRDSRVFDSSKAQAGVWLIEENFSCMQEALAKRGVDRVHGILADLGMSSDQLYDAERGFGHMHEGAPLDMRMSAGVGRTAADLLEKASAEELSNYFTAYAELPRGRALAHSVVGYRSKRAIKSVGDLLEVARPYAPIRQRMRFFSQLFQALRVAINDELNALKSLLYQAARLLVKGGRLAIISYHSLEDRMVKRFIHHGHFERTPLSDERGNPLPVPFYSLYKKPIKASDEEREANPSSRSALLRIGCRTDAELS